MRWKVNLNGDSRDTLVNELMEILWAADALLDRVSDLTVNMRNYPQGVSDFLSDRDERSEMARKVEEIRGWAVNSALGLMGEENA